MYLRAVSIGRAVPRMQFDAVVHSVFASAVNLQPVASRQLLTLLISSEGDLPQGIRLEPSASLSFETLRAGAPAACRSGLLHIDGSPATIDLYGAVCWDSSLPLLQADLSLAAVTAAWLQAWHALNDRQLARASELQAETLLAPGPGGQPLWVGQAARCLRGLLRLTARCDARSLGALHDLIGLGPGLTPSGDDLATGYLLGLRYAARDSQARIDFLSALAAAVMQALPRTGDISGTYLFHAARGEPSSPLFGLARAICSGAAQRDVLRSAELAMSLGHTSGMDAVTGLLFGLAAWDAPALLGPAPQA